MANGYPPPPALLRDYTRRQLDLFYREAKRRQHHARADRMEDLRVAYHYPAKDFTAKTRALRER